MKIFQIKQRQNLKISLSEAWDFFSNPRNLMKITPPELKMRTISEVPEKMYRGEIITYTIKPLLGLPMTWVSEITHVRDMSEFIDEQRFGPYAFWHHLHTLIEVNGGIQVGDLVHYGLPFGPFSSMVNDLLVKKQLDKIFNHRSCVLRDKFGEISEK